MELTALRPALPASDLERAKGWYADKLGLHPVNITEFGDVEYESGGAMFFLYASEFAGTNQATAAGFRVPDFDSVVESLRTNGVVFEHVDFGEIGATVDGVISVSDGELKAAWFKDSEGNTLSLSN